MRTVAVIVAPIRWVPLLVDDIGVDPVILTDICALVAEA
jgi:hypothetical protein